MEPIQVLEPASTPPHVERPQFRVHVIYTGEETTRASLEVATELAKDLGARLELLLPIVVPYPLPLDSPSTPTSFTEGAVSALVSDCSVDVEVKVLLCRDREETIPRWIPAASIVIIGRFRRWGPGSHRGIIRSVNRSGHHVIVVEGHGKMLAPDPALKRRESR